MPSLTVINMKGVRQEQLWIGILVCAAIVAIPAFIAGVGRSAVLIRAVRRGSARRVESILDSRPQLVHGIDRRTGASPLHWAAIEDRPDMAKLLLERGADVNASDNHGMTPLHKAADFNRRAVAELLLANGADIGARGVKYRALLVTPLHVAAEAGFPEIVEALLNAGANVDAPTGGANAVTGLHMSASRGHFNVARLLLQRGADVNVRDSHGATPLHWARISGQNDIVELLRVYGGAE